ncbi:hypothetical protein KCP77_20750 [Salmonella enterica subsp. enterica]|nr:hypothetical protein KCP77_20750 [Salmonella enterica subsp. enterica]
MTGGCLSTESAARAAPPRDYRSLLCRSSPATLCLRFLTSIIQIRRKKVLALKVIRSRRSLYVTPKTPPLG